MQYAPRPVGTGIWAAVLSGSVARMRKTRWLATALTAVALAAAGCGGDDEEETTTTGQSAPPAETQDGGTSGGGDTAGAGRELFSNSCGGCHTLADAETSGASGPNLDELKPDVDRVKQAIAQGPGIMPENLYEGAEADQVAEYVAEAAGN